MLLRVTASAFNDRGPLYMVHALAAIHEGSEREPITWSLARVGSQVALLCDAPPSLRPLIEGQILAHYPTAQVMAVAEDAALAAGVCRWTLDLTLAPDVLPIQRFTQFEDLSTRTSADPLTGVLAALAGSERDPLRACVELTAQPAHRRHVRRARRALLQLNRPLLTTHPEWGRTFLTWALAPRRWRRIAVRLLVPLAGRRPHVPIDPHASSRSHDREDPVTAAHDKLGRRLFAATLRIVVIGPADQERRALLKLQEIVGALGQLASPHLAEFHAKTLRRWGSAPRKSTRAFLLSTEELATLWHVPTLAIQPPTLDLATYHQLEPPSVLPDPRSEPDAAFLGRTVFRQRRDRVGIRGDDRRRHLYVVGKTGMGKSTLLFHLFTDDVAAGRGCALVDPHGDLAETVLSAVPAWRTNDVVLFDAGDRTHPVAFNPLAGCAREDRPLVASGVLSAFKKLFGDSWGPRMEHVFRNCLLALLETPGTSLVSVVELLADARYRQSVLSRVTDPLVRGFWLQEFAGMPARLQAEAIAPVQNKVGHFVSNPWLRQIIGAPRSTIALRSIIDSGKVLVVNLSKGRMGEDASNLLGALVVSSLQLAAMARADVAEEARPDFYFYVDEFQNFATESFATILSEARKYRLCLTLANQYLAQMDEATAAAVFGNVGSLLSFQVGAEDAEPLAVQLGGHATPQDLLALPRYEAYLRLLIDGVPSRPFSLRTLRPDTATLNPARAEIVRRASRRRYGRPLAAVATETERVFSPLAQNQDG